MPGRIVYLDSSAIVKLLVTEPESQALRARLSDWPDRIASAIVRTEVVRALRRSGNGERVADARRLLHRLQLISVYDELLDRAGDAPPPTLRSLDAIHVATALSVGSELDVAISYDERRRNAFASAGIEALAPH
jgi:uncharacterized protein